MEKSKDTKGTYFWETGDNFDNLGSSTSLRPCWNFFRWHISYLPFVSFFTQSLSVLHLLHLVYSLTGSFPNKTLAQLALSWYLLIKGLGITVTEWLSDRKWACYPMVLMSASIVTWLVGLVSRRVAVISIFPYFCVTNYFLVYLPHVNSVL